MIVEAAEHVVSLSELAQLLTWLCAPWIVAALSVQVTFLRRRGVFAPGRRHRALVAAVGTVVLTLLLAAALLVALPPALLPGSLLPTTWPSLPPLQFFPGCVAAAVAAAAFSYWAMHGVGTDPDLRSNVS